MGDDCALEGRCRKPGGNDGNGECEWKPDWAPPGGYRDRNCSNCDQTGRPCGRLPIGREVKNDSAPKTDGKPGDQTTRPDLRQSPGAQGMPEAS